MLLSVIARRALTAALVAAAGAVGSYAIRHYGSQHYPTFAL